MSAPPPPPTYCTVDEGTIYFSTRLHSDAWNSASDADKFSALVMATRAIDRLRFVGQRNDLTQQLQFPRGTDLTVPQDIKDAACEIALVLLDDVDPDQEIKNLSAVSQGYSSVRSSFDRGFALEHIAAGIPSATAWHLLLPYLADVRNVTLRRTV